MASKIENLNWQEMTVPSLVAATALRLEILIDRWIFKPLDLTAASFRILAILAKFGQLSPTDIIGYLGGTKSNITQRLNFLSRCGWIKTKRPQAGDRRKILVALSRTGRNKLAQVKASFAQHNLQVENFFNRAELKNFQKFIIKFNRSLDDCENKFCANRPLNK